MNPFPIATVASVGQYINTTLQSAIAKTLDGELMLRVVGTLGALRKTSYSTIYGVHLTDNGATVLLDIPRTLASAKNLRGGEAVMVTGAICARMSQQNGSIEARIAVSDIAVRGNNSAETHTRDRATISGLKQLGMHRYPFPASIRPTVALISSRSSNAQVDHDFLQELGIIAQDLPISRQSINMQSSHEIASAIERADAEIIVLIRGGGDADQFMVFEDGDVVKALATKEAYRIVGLGHTGNSTLLDLVADFSANTPTQAGGHIRDRIARTAQIAGEYAAQNSLLSAQVRERDMFIRSLKTADPSSINPQRNTFDRIVRVGTLIGVWGLLLSAACLALTR